MALVCLRNFSCPHSGRGLLRDARISCQRALNLCILFFSQDGGWRLHRAAQKYVASPACLLRAAASSSKVVVVRAGQTLGRIGLTTHFFRWLGPERLQRSHACGHVFHDVFVVHVHHSCKHAEATAFIHEYASQTLACPLHAWSLYNVKQLSWCRRRNVSEHKF